MDPNSHPHLLNWWKENPSDPDPTLDNPHVQHLIAEIGLGTGTTDLGGVMSLNARLDALGLVLRVHQPFVTRQRLLAVQQVRQRLADLELVVPIAVSWRNSTVFRCGERYAELEQYIAHKRLEPTFDSYSWLFNVMGTLHKALATLDVTVPRPLIATYAPPSSLLRWLSVTEVVVQGNTEAVKVAQLVRKLVKHLRGQWIPSSQLPQQLIHGDVRLSNVCQTLDRKTLYLDFGFLARRSRIHDIAYSLAFMFLALHQQKSPEHFEWQRVLHLIEEYERAANTRFTVDERKALVPYIAAVPLYAAALAGFSNNPPTLLLERVPFLHLSEWLLAHSDVV